MTDEEARNAERKWRYFELHGSPPEWAHLLPPRPSPRPGPMPIAPANEREMVLKSNVSFAGPQVDAVVATMMPSAPGER